MTNAACDRWSVNKGAQVSRILDGHILQEMVALPFHTRTTTTKKRKNSLGIPFVPQPLGCYTLHDVTLDEYLPITSRHNAFDLYTQRLTFLPHSLVCSTVQMCQTSMNWLRVFSVISVHQSRIDLVNKTRR